MANNKQPFILKQGMTVQGGDTRLESTGYLRLPIGAVSDRPTTPEFGMFRGNTDTGGTEDYFNGQWWDVDHKVKWVVRNTNTTVANGYSSYGIALDTSGGSVIVTLPAVPVKDDYIVVSDATGNFAIHNASIDPGSNKINGVAGVYALKYKNQCITMNWSGNSVIGWIVTANVFDMTQYAAESEETAFVFALLL